MIIACDMFQHNAIGINYDISQKPTLLCHKLLKYVYTVCYLNSKLYSSIVL
jgi:hypothetical protein